MAPFYALPLMFLSYSVLVLLIDGVFEQKTKTSKNAGIAGWWFGFGYFVVGIHWFGFAFLVQAEQFAWMAPFAVLGLSAFLALFIALPSALSVRIWRDGPLRVIFFAAALCIFDYLRGHILTGLPWNLPGQSYAGLVALAQTAAWWGAYGLSVVALLIAMAPVAFVKIGRSGTTGCTYKRCHHLPDSIRNDIRFGRNAP